METVLTNNLVMVHASERSGDPFGNRIGLAGRIFGCWHKELSRPFSSAKGSYRACLDCGARKKFDADTFETLATFYYPPMPAHAANTAG